MGKLTKGVTAVRRVQNWHKMILDHFRLLPPGPIQYRIRSGEVFNARKRTYDVNAIEEVWVLDFYTQNGLVIGPNDTVMDIGAHIGAFSVFAARAAAHGKVIAFEPVPNNYDLLMQNIAANGLINVTPIRAAISSSVGSRQMFLQADDHVGHSLYPRNLNGGQITVQTITLSEAMAEHGVDRINFLKLDCEGAEFDILLNAPDSVMARIDSISMEVHPSEGCEPETLRSLLLSKGFTVACSGEYMYAIRQDSRHEAAIFKSS